MARNTELYKGRKKRHAWPRVVLIVLLVLIAGALLLFYGLQKYIVYTPNGVSLELPLLAGNTASPAAESGGEAAVSGPDAKLVIDQTDYSDIEATAGADLTAVKAIYVPFDSVTADGITKAAGRLNKGNALVLELKTASGKLAWASAEREATAYDLAGSTDLKSAVKALKAAKPNVWLVGELCCCVDDLMAERNSPLALKKADGSAYTDDTGAWLDPTNAELRTYIADLAKELADMGFDEVLLSQVCGPDTDPAGLAFSATSTGDAAASAVTGFSLAVTRALAGSGVKVSVVAARAAISQSADNHNGQKIEALMKVFDRVYCYTSASEYKTYQDDCAAFCTVGDIADRFVPVCSGSLPDTDCWVLADSGG